MRLSSLAAATFAAAGLLAAPAEAAFTTAPSVTYQYYSQIMTITPNGPTTFSVAPGANYSISGDFVSTTRNQPTGCPGGVCLQQGYLAGLLPLIAQIDLWAGTEFSNTAGSYAATFTAPIALGTYYIGASTTLEYGFVPGVVGQANADGQVSYIVSVVPEPASLAILSLGLVGLAAARRRRAAPDAAA